MEAALLFKRCILRLFSGPVSEGGVRIVRGGVAIGPDGLCRCNCGSSCPLGRSGMESRCKREELELSPEQLLPPVPQEPQEQFPWAYDAGRRMALDEEQRIIAAFDS